MEFKKGFEVQTEKNRCLNYWHRGILCAHCADRCPTGAVTVADDHTVRHDSETCVGCGLCVSTCPTQVFRAGHWDEQTIVRDVAGNGWTKVHLFCGYHEKPYSTEPGNTGAVRVPGCLAGMTRGLWFELGKQAEVELHLENCTDCELNKTLPYLADHVTVAAEWLAAVGAEARFFEVLQPFEGKVKKRHRAISTGLKVTSRRDLFLNLVERGRKFIAEEREEKRGKSAGIHPPEWMLRLEETYPREVPEGAAPAYWPSVRIEETCKGCGLCTSYCPTGALHLSETESGYTQMFVCGRCIDCRICELFCPSEAIGRSRRQNPVPFETVCVHSVEGTVCRRCGMRTVEHKSGLCHWCRLGEDVEVDLLDTCRQILFGGKEKPDA